MGLDQSAYACAWTLKELQSEKETPMEEIMYWRKHNRLQGWMEELWHKKYDDDDDVDTHQSFNCVYVELEEEDIDALEHYVLSESLPATMGFFFGLDSYDTEPFDDGSTKKSLMFEKDMRFIEAARQVLQMGLKVYYWSWW